MRRMLLAVLTKPRAIVTTGLELAGTGVIVYGISQVSVTAAVIAAGIGLILIGVLAA